MCASLSIVRRVYRNASSTVVHTLRWRSSNQTRPMSLNGWSRSSSSSSLLIRFEIQNLQPSRVRALVNWLTGTKANAVRVWRSVSICCVSLSLPLNIGLESFPNAPELMGYLLRTGRFSTLVWCLPQSGCRGLVRGCLNIFILFISCFPVSIFVLCLCVACCCYSFLVCYSFAAAGNPTGQNT